MGGKLGKSFLFILLLCQGVWATTYSEMREEPAAREMMEAPARLICTGSEDIRHFYNPLYMGVTLKSAQITTFGLEKMVTEEGKPLRELLHDLLFCTMPTNFTRPSMDLVTCSKISHPDGKMDLDFLCNMNNILFIENVQECHSRWFQTQCGIEFSSALIFDEQLTLKKPPSLKLFVNY